MTYLNTFTTANLVRIIEDESYGEHHEEALRILSNRSDRLCMDSAIAYLELVATRRPARGFDTPRVTYTEFFAHVTDRSFNRFDAARYLGTVQDYCTARGWPLLSSLVVTAADGNCGSGFFEHAVAHSGIPANADPRFVEEASRRASVAWAKSRNS